MDLPEQSCHGFLLGRDLWMPTPAYWKYLCRRSVQPSKWGSNKVLMSEWVVDFIMIN